MKSYFLAVQAATILATGLLVPAAARASLAGDTVDLTYYYPDSASVYWDFGTQTVPTAAYDLGPISGPMYLTVTGTQIIGVQYPGAYDDYILPVASFDGLVLTDLTNSDISNVTLESETDLTLTSDEISWTAGSISINWAGVEFGATGDDTSFVLDVSTDVPEPATLSLFGTGLLGLLRAVRRRA